VHQNASAAGQGHSIGDARCRAPSRRDAVLILQDEATGEPVVIQLAAPRTVVAIDDTSEHHLTLAIGEHSAIKLRLVMANHIAAAMARAVVEQLGR